MPPEIALLLNQLDAALKARTFTWAEAREISFRLEELFVEVLRATPPEDGPK